MNKKLLSFLLVFCLCFSFNFAQQPGKARHNNLRKLAKISDKKSGLFKSEKDNPKRRFEFETEMLVDPKTGNIPENIREKELSYVNSSSSKLKGKSEFFRVRSNAGSWQNRGPYNVGGRTRTVVIDVANDNVILAGGVSGGVWRSTNGGQNWTKTTGSSQLQSVTCIAQDPRPGNQNVWYYTTGEYRGNSAVGGGNADYLGNGVYKSTDGGVSWSSLSFTASNTAESFDSYFDFNWRIIVNPINGDLYVASFGRIHKSTNGGASWSISLDGGSANYTDVFSTSSGVLFAVIDSEGNPKKGIFRSLDGINWVLITPSDFPTNYERIVLSGSKTNSNMVYFMAETPSAGKLGHALYKYTYTSGIGNGDGSSGNGGLWENRSANIPAYGGEVGDFTSQGSYDLVIGVHPDNANVVFIGGTNLYRSSDGFSSTSNTSWIGGYATSNDVNQYQNHHPDIHSLAFFSTKANKMLCGHDGGISVTDNNLANNGSTEPVNWTFLNNGYLTTQAYAIAIDQSNLNDDKIIAGFQDNGSWSTGSNISSNPWQEEFSGDGGYCAFSNGGLVRYVSSQDANIFRFEYNSNGDFIKWTRITPTNISDPKFITPFTIDPNNNNIVYIPGKDRLWRNNDVTAITPFVQTTTTVNWEELTNTSVNATITSLDVSKNISNRVCFGTNNGKVYRLDNANIGNPKAVDISGNNFPNAYVSCIKIDPDNADNIFVVFSNYSVKSIFNTTNGGSTWTDISGNLEQNGDGSGNGPSVRWIDILKLGNTFSYFVGTSTGLYATSILNGTSTIWTIEGSNSIGNMVVSMLKTRNDGTVVVASHGNGIFSAKLTYSACQTTFSTINPVVCSSYILPSGKLINLSGKYTDTLVNFNGCDSIITINLTIKTVDVSIKQTINSLTANAKSASYQWLDCNKGYSVINSETKQSFSPNVNGNYAVEIDQIGCKDTSACFAWFSVKVESNDFGSSLVVYPNPTKGNLFVNLGESYQGVIVAIRDLKGQLIETKNYEIIQQINLDIKGAAGYYFIEINTQDGKSANIKVLKQ